MKNRIFKSLLATALVGTMMLSTVGCGETVSVEESNVAQVSTQETADNTETVENKEPETISIAMRESTYIEDYDTNYMTLKLEEELGVNIEFVMFPNDVEEAKTKLSLMANANEELPDVILLTNSNAFTHAEVLEYANAGIFVPLNDYFEDASVTPNFHAIAEQNPEDAEVILSTITSPDGNIYSFFSYVPAPWNLTPYRIRMNMEWLKAVGKEVPKTTEELREVLYAFATEDPNGNGIKDEIPLTGSTKAWGGNVAFALMNSFVFTNANMNNTGLALGDDGATVVAPFATEEWRDGLEYMRELCEDGLLDPAVFTQSQDALKALLDQETNVVGCITAGSHGLWAGALDSENFAEFDLIAPIAGPEGVAYTPTMQYSPARVFYITSDCENPELAAKIGDWFLAEENSISTQYGEEGVEWSREKEHTSQYVSEYDALGYDCKVAIISNITTEVQNKTWSAVSPRYESVEMGKGMGLAKAGGDTRSSYYVAKNYELYSEAHPDLLPELNYTVEESEAIAEIATNIKDYVATQMAAFVTGNVSMDEWNNYLAELENMGLKTWLETAQAAYDRITK